MAIVAKALLPPDPLPVGTPQDQFYTVINLNYFRIDVALLPALSFESSQPVSPADGELYVLDGDWGLTFEDEEGNPISGDGLLAYYTGGTWYYFIPAQGMLKRIGADYYTYDPDSSAEWHQFTVPTAAGLSTVTGTSRNLLATDVGNYLRFTNGSAKTLTVQDNADEAIGVGSEVHGRNANTGNLTIVEDTAVTVNAPAGGTLVIPPGGTFTLKKVATDEWDLFGVTVAV